jgi:hypothetical protein
MSLFACAFLTFTMAAWLACAMVVSALAHVALCDYLIPERVRLVAHSYQPGYDGQARWALMLTIDPTVLPFFGVAPFGVCCVAGQRR